MEGYLVDYERVPITDEKSPKELDFDILVSSCVLNISSNKSQPCLIPNVYSLDPIKGLDDVVAFSIILSMIFW